MQRALIDRHRSCLLLVDVQEHLVPAIHGHERLVDNCRWLLSAARDLSVPVLATEQYPAGLGPTVAPLRELLAPENVSDKTTFSCCAAKGFPDRVAGLERGQVIIAGIEAHVCVLQTVHGLLELGYTVFPVADVVSSRSAGDEELAIRRMRDAGAIIVSREMVLFEWLGRAGTPEFKRISARYLKA